MPSVPDTRSSLQQEVQAVCIKLVARRGLVAGLSAPSAAVLLYFVLDEEGMLPTVPFWSWFACLCLALFIQLLVDAWVLVHKPDARMLQRWPRINAATLVLVGLAWGSAGWWLQSPSPLFTMMLYLVLAGVGALVMIVQSAFMLSVVAVELALLLPGMLHGVLGVGRMAQYVGVASFLYFCLLCLYGWVVHRQLRHGVRASVQASLLNEDLMAANVRAASALEALKREHKQLQQALQTIERMAHVDELTQLPNRRAAMAELKRLVEADATAALVLLDVDHFKQVNDNHGHHAGDAVLRGVAERMLACLRQDDLLARFGGEEFVLILPDTELADAHTLAQRLCDTLAAQALPVEGARLPVTASFGVTPHHPGEALHGWLARADEAMYQAKHAGRNRVALLP
ncbi:GGDEF domain-containing protein [Vogesella sp. LIG4]|uniref:GGDEF domain-containing protein n=1 Tax=Vogesella sp. LIG4 TaxID=1192162 RepID=UPI0012FD03D8|nr:GGDEF domain-containing protein [Vogesella sp. LIG4]